MKRNNSANRQGGHHQCLGFFCRPLAAGASCAEMASDGDEGEGGRIVKAQPSIMSRGSRQEVNGKRTALFEERGDQREPLEGHEEESGKKVTAGEKCRRCKVASVTGFMGREGRRGRRRTSPLSLDVDVKHITFNSQSPDLSLYRLTWFSGSWM